MKATFVELPPFERHRSRYLDDEGLRALQEAMLVNPEMGPVIQAASSSGFSRYTTRTNRTN
jgi:hypothetical protein